MGNTLQSLRALHCPVCPGRAHGSTTTLKYTHHLHTKIWTEGSAHAHPITQLLLPGYGDAPSNRHIFQHIYDAPKAMHDLEGLEDVVERKDRENT